MNVWFPITIFFAAFLLFQVQPLVGRFILPWFGGGPGVWSACLLFFQVVLLLGYAYAHLINRRLEPRLQAVVHGVVLLVALVWLPLDPQPQWRAEAGQDPTWRILALLTHCVGWPYFVLASTGPLLQAWAHRLSPAQSPYRLYALSNTASLLALLSYPFLIEPCCSRLAQTWVWSWGVVLFVVGCGLCAWQVWRGRLAGGEASLCGASSGDSPASASGLKVLSVADPPATATSTPGGGGCSGAVRPLLWFLLPACASVLLLASTNRMCQDVAVVPFLWVLPLAIYLVTFVLCFDHPRWYLRKTLQLVLLPVLGLTCWTLFEGRDFSLLAQVVIYALGVFVGGMVCHGELYRLRPDPHRLTSYYLMIAAGGAAGGAFVALLAPLLFQSYSELSCGWLLLALLLVAVHGRDRTRLRFPSRWLAWPFVAVLGLALGIVLWYQAQDAERNARLTTRNFYGVLRVFTEAPDTVAESRRLQSGEITHGLQLMHPNHAFEPTAYYHQKTGVGLAMLHFPRQVNRRIGVIGLGVGTLAAYGREGDVLRFYEINPAVKKIAEEHFTFLARCPARVEVVLGDARLSMERESSQEFDLLVLDAFSGDAIPMHLLTREAFSIYRRHLKPDGVIALHITNRHLDLRPVAEGLANAFHLDTALITWARQSEPWWLMRANWMLLSDNRSFLQSPEIRRATAPRPARPSSPRLWTDDQASLFGVLKKPRWTTRDQ